MDGRRDGSCAAKQQRLVIRQANRSWACDKEGKPYSARYDQVNAILLSEFLKEWSDWGQSRVALI